MLSDYPYALYWHPNAALHGMDGSVFYSAGLMKTVCVCLALFWVAYRAYKVLAKPVEELVHLLGLEVPVAPIVSLAGIKADGILLHWKPPDSRSSIAKYLVRINGIDIDHVSPLETSVTVTDLLPNHHYTVRIVTVNTASFQAPSVPLRVKTLRADSGHYFNISSHKEESNGDDKDSNPAPVVRPCKTFGDAHIPPPTPPPMAREHSNSQSRVRRVDTARRSSPASQTADQAHNAQESTAAETSIQQLTERLEALRQEVDDVERQIADEEEEFQCAKASLGQKRDEKKYALKEREDASRDLRKEVASLERANTAAQARRTTQEKSLQQKESERRKLRSDIVRWESEIQEMRAEAEQAENDRMEYLEASEQKIKELKDKHSEEISVNKSLEEVIHEKGIQIKTLEEEKKRIEGGDDENENPENTQAAEADEDKMWMQTLAALQSRYATAWNLFSDAERINQDAHRRLQYLEQRRASQPHLFSTMPMEGLSGRRGSRRRTGSLRNELIASAAPAGFVPTTAPPFNTSISSISPSFASPTPYFNINNGMAIPLAHTSFSPAEVEALTGGAPMSPTAGALLPSGLFGDDLEKADVDEDDEHSSGSGLSSHNPSSGFALPGLGAPQTLEPIQSPSSPVSIQSRSPSVFASPRDSNSHLAFIPGAAENLIESDRRSIRSTSSSLMAATGNGNPTTRFGNLFGLNRQRGKTLSDDGPPLGSLKSSQSHSMPRQEPDLDPIGTRRRRGSYSGAWYDAFTRNKPVAEDPQNSQKHIATRKRAFNMFGSKGDPWLSSSLGLNRPSSPRQGSTKSGEVSLLPRPSTESQQRFGWPVDGFGQRSSPLGADWSIANTSSWSRHPSRRPSVQYNGSTASLLHDGIPFGEVTDEFPNSSKSPTQAPIGTRPQSSASMMPPPVPPTPPKQLNPTAPNFKIKEAKKAEKNVEKKAKADKAAEKAARKDKEKALALETAAVDSGKDTSSPMDPRRSRDNRSISTAPDESASSPRESLERLVSQTPSESQAPSSVGRESFMTKLARKGSTTKFLHKFTNEKGLLSVKKAGEVGTPDETDEDGGSNHGAMAKSVESVSSSPLLGSGSKDNRSSALSWSSIKRMGKRGDKTPSLHESIASEATTGDEDEGYTSHQESYVAPSA
ncbi:hypothetical protein BU16DRAFT_488794 [Lophium mytilinum]|uniref:Fibronectin type-III domain-containing protein n=1 Tax=Lophium mytilinum TaxID=390894 RepID=A0A6A6QQE1_9PEZI|nr:hypothetical protein BU16DRAFT_488794 [Lophium mytilinum]